MTVPDGVTSPILSPFELANQMLPSGPAVTLSGEPMPAAVKRGDLFRAPAAGAGEVEGGQAGEHGGEEHWKVVVRIGSDDPPGCDRVVLSSTCPDSGPSPPGTTQVPLGGAAPASRENHGMDLTVGAIPFYFSSMGRGVVPEAPRRRGPVELGLRARRHPGQPGHGHAQPRRPPATRALAEKIAPQRSKVGKACRPRAGAAAVTTVADWRSLSGRAPPGPRPGAAVARGRPDRRSSPAGSPPPPPSPPPPAPGRCGQQGLAAAGTSAPARGPRPRHRRGTSSTTGTTASTTRPATSGRTTWPITRRSATTSRPRCASPSPTS